MKESPIKTKKKRNLPNFPDDIVSNSLSKLSTEEKKVYQDEIEIKNVEVETSYTTTYKIIQVETRHLKEKDDFQLVKFTITLEAFHKYTHKYEWTLYHRPIEIIQNFKDILSELEDNKIEPPKDFINMKKEVDKWDPTGLAKEKKIAIYYTELFREQTIFNTLAFKEFFCISSASFNQYNEGSKPFEGWVYKKAEPRCLRRALSVFCICIERLAFAQFNKRWIVVKDDCIYYMNKSNSENGKNVYFFDLSTRIVKEDDDTIFISNNSNRYLVLKFKARFDRDIWYNEIYKRSENMKKILSSNPYNAFTNIKSNNDAKWFIDGEQYFKDLASELMNAKETIFITDWWLSPEVWLTRPVAINTYTTLAFNRKIRKESPPYSRLMDILYECANRGVKIYIQVYAEYTYVLTLDSIHTQNTLNSLHKNIHVERHPTNMIGFLWSHHEKLVIIDQLIGYVGGLDLCWGRYDKNSHPIQEPSQKVDSPEYFFPGIDYSNARIRDFERVSEYLKESANRDKETRMPWHDVHCKIIGPVVSDIARHFVERWNFIKFGTHDGITDIKQSSSFMEPVNKKKEAKQKKVNIFGKFIMDVAKKIEKKENKKDELVEVEDIGEILDGSEEINENNENNIINSEEDSILEKDNTNEEIKSKKGYNSFINNLVHKNSELSEKEKQLKEAQEKFMENKEFIDEDHFLNLKSPYYKGNVYGTGNNLLLESILRGGKASNDDNNLTTNNTTMRLLNEEESSDNNINNEIKEEKKEEKKTFYNTFVEHLVDHSKTTNKGWFSKFLMPKNIEEKSNNKLENNIVNVKYFSEGIKSNVQVLRSSCDWSAGIKKEDSILQAYIKLIRESEHCIYIENQFFVSRPYDDEEANNCSKLSDVVKNTIAYEIRQRILRAYKEGKKFRVIIFIPLLPGFAGDPEESGTLQIILKYTYASICRNYGTSIIEKLSEKMENKDDWKKYIGFYSLRNHDLVRDVPTTEIIYIHSKLMIVDDKHVIIGSANINDRSMLGSRDSEFCVLIQEKLDESKYIIDGKKTPAADFAHNFRTSLLAEHLGLKPDDNILFDPLSDELWEKLNNTAKKNTEIYRELWNCYPDDNMKKFTDLKKVKKINEFNEKEMNELKNLYNIEKVNIKGHIVEFPLHFLEGEVLGIKFFSKENIVPENNYT